MKFFCTLPVVTLLLLGLTSYGQDQGFIFDENGQIIFTEVVELEGQREELRQRLENLLGAGKSIQRNDDLSLSVSEDFLLYQHSLGKITDGRVDYILKVEVKNNKYRYTIQNFTYTPFFRNRYGRYEAKRGSSRPLEEFLNKNQTKWKQHFVEVHERIAQKTYWLKSGMINVEIPNEQKVVKLKDDW